MPLNNIDSVRFMIGDMNKVSVSEFVAKGPVVGVTYQLDLFPVRTGSVTVLVSGIVRTSATGNIALGTIDFTAVATAVTAQAEVRATYQYNSLSDQEIERAIDLASGGGPMMAAAIAARAIAGNAARLFSYSQGDKSVNKDHVSDKLMKLAESLETGYEKSVQLQGTTMTVTTFDDSGTPFDGYDTASSVVITGTGL